MNMKTIKLFVALCAMFLFGLEAYAQEAMTKMKKTYPVAMQEYGKKMSELKTDYIIAIDVSATMGKHKDEVVPALTRFFDSIGDGNFVQIVSFGTIAKVEQTRLEITKDSRPNIVEKLNYVYDNVMNDRLMRGHTDFVLLGKKVVELVQSDDKSDIHFVVVFSDIMDDPGTKAPGSRHRAEKEWNDLRQQFNTLEVPVNTLSTYFSHEAKDENQILESIELVKGTFPNFEYSNDINAVLGDLLEDSKFVIYADKLKQLITYDINEVGSKVLFSSMIAKDKNLTLEYDFDKEEVKAPKYIRGIVIDTCILEENTPQIVEIEFDSHKEIAKRGGSKNIGKVIFERGKIFVKNQTADYKMGYHFIYQVNKDEKANSFTMDMEALGLLDKLPQKTTVHAEGPLVFIWPFWLIVLLGVLALVFLVLLLKNTIIPGRIRNKQFFCKNMLGETSDFTVQNMRSFCIGKPEKCENTDWGIPDTGFLVKVKAKNGGPLNLVFKKKIVFVLIDGNDVVMTQGGVKLEKGNILKGPITVEDGFGRPYEFSEADLILK
jgi:hypothetical protein